MEKYLIAFMLTTFISFAVLPVAIPFVEKFFGVDRIRRGWVRFVTKAALSFFFVADYVWLTCLAVNLRPGFTLVATTSVVIILVRVVLLRYFSMPAKQIPEPAGDATNQERRVLVIVDMQEDFPAAANMGTVTACAAQIQKAMERGWTIVRLEYKGYGDTIHHLTDLLAPYNRAVFKEKSRTDGSEVVMEALRERNIVPSVIRVCGINITGCVYSTVVGFIHGQKFVPVEVVRDACNDSLYNDWSHYPRHQRLRIANAIELD